MISDKLVIGIFADYDAAREVLDALRKEDFSPEDISVVGSDPDELRMATVELQDRHPDKVITVGAVLGAIGGWLVGLAAVSIPGVGPFLAAGPLLASISGAAAGSLAGCLAGALIHFDVPQYMAKVCEGHLSQGKILVAVHSHDRDTRIKAEDIMERFGAIEVDSRPEPAAALANPNS